jgi:hypothetical protein
MMLHVCVITGEGLADDDLRRMSLPGGALQRRRGRNRNPSLLVPRLSVLRSGKRDGKRRVSDRAVTMKGPLRDYSSIADSGNRMHRQFCERCGTPVSSTAEARPHLTILRAGTLDNPELARPSLTIWTDSAPSWACVNEALPRAPRQPPPAV